MSSHSKVEEAVYIARESGVASTRERELWSQVDHGACFFFDPGQVSYFIFKMAISNITYFRNLCESSEVIYVKPLSTVIGKK